MFYLVFDVKKCERHGNGTDRNGFLYRLRNVAWWLGSKCRKVEQERLAIIRYNNVAVEYVRGLSKRQIIGYLLEVPTVFLLLHPDAL